MHEWLTKAGLCSLSEMQMQPQLHDAGGSILCNLCPVRSLHSSGIELFLRTTLSFIVSHIHPERGVYFNGNECWPQLDLNKPSKLVLKDRTDRVLSGTETVGTSSLKRCFAPRLKSIEDFLETLVLYKI